MGRGKLLNEFEKGQILAYRSECLSIRDIANLISRSPKTVWRFINLQDKGIVPRTPVLHRKISSSLKRALVRKASLGESSARELQVTLKLNIGVRRIQQMLSSTNHLKYRKMLKAPMMTARNKENRLTWARRNISKGDNFWAKVAFSDEKKFNLDGPDGLSMYWHDLRTEQRRFQTR